MKTIFTVIITACISLAIGFSVGRLTAPRAALRRPGTVMKASPAWTSTEKAAAGSVEEQLRSEGKTWAKTSGDIEVGAYVQDTLEGRMGQPKGRGAVGKVVEVSPTTDNPRAATVDFGRGYKAGINFSELSLVDVRSQ